MFHTGFRFGAGLATGTIVTVIGLLALEEYIDRIWNWLSTEPDASSTG